AVRAVLVLDLHEDHAATAVDLPRRDDGVHLLEVRGDLGDIGRIAAAQLHAVVSGQPGGQSAVVPLRADVVSRPDDRVHALFGDAVEEAAEVDVAVLAPLPLARLVRVPGDV